jgi:hypothetical protein
MVVDPSSATRLSRLLVELNADLDALAARHRDGAALVVELERDSKLPERDVVVLAVHLHGYYTALETLLERIARLLDQEVPSGPTWHVELVQQMRVDVAGVRPAVVPAEIVTDLHHLRRFRHFFRNAYLLQLDPVRVGEHARRMLRVHPPLLAALAAFSQHLAAVRRRLQDDA